MRGVLAARQIHSKYLGFRLPRGGESLLLSAPAINCTGQKVSPAQATACSLW